MTVFLAIVGSLLLGYVLGLLYICYYYGFRGSRLVSLVVGFVIILPAVVVEAIVKYIVKCLKDKAISKRKLFVFIPKMLGSFIIATPIALNDALNDLAPQNAAGRIRRKKTTFSNIKGKILTALSRTIEDRSAFAH